MTPPRPEQPATRSGRALLEVLEEHDRINRETVSVDWAHGIVAVEREMQALSTREEQAAAAALPDVAVPPETEAVRRCVTHHSCACHERLAEIGRRYLAAKEQTDG